MLKLETFNNFPDFELLDSGNGKRLERWSDVLLSRPDPAAIWQPSMDSNKWKAVSATFEDKNWTINQPLPNPWVISWNNTKFLLKLTPFKHTGIFAEQAANWEWLTDKLKTQAEKRQINILNLFAYTGASTIVLAKAGCFVTHVDASKPSIGWAKENHQLNNLPGDSVRWILDDAVKFVKREIKRGASYDGILMDPPAFGHGPTGNIWKWSEHLPRLLDDCVQLLSPKAKFLLINGYATNSSALGLSNLVEDALHNTKHKANIEFGELCLTQKNGRMLSTGIFNRASF